MNCRLRTTVLDHQVMTSFQGHRKDSKDIGWPYSEYSAVSSETGINRQFFLKEWTLAKLKCVRAICTQSFLIILSPQQVTCQPNQLLPGILQESTRKTQPPFLAPQFSRSQRRFGFPVSWCPVPLGERLTLSGYVTWVFTWLSHYPSLIDKSNANNKYIFYLWREGTDSWFCLRFISFYVCAFSAHLV